MRPFLAALVLFGASVASCTAILGDVPTSGETGGGGGAGQGGASTASSGSTSSRGGSTAANTGGGAPDGGGPTSPTSVGGGGGGVVSCGTQGQACDLSMLTPCCSNLSCIQGTCSAPSTGTSSSSSGGGPCTTCEDVIGHGQSPTGFCQGSKMLFDALAMCACESCQACSLACSQMQMLGSDCYACAEMDCMVEYNACKNDN